MNRHIAAAATGAVAIILTAFAALQRPDAEDVTDVLLRVNGPLRLAAGDSASTVVVIGHDATVEGTVREQLIVVGGTARVSGSVLGNLVVVNGRAVLGPEAYVGENVVLHESGIERAPGARVGGVVRRRAEFAWSPLVGWIFWLSLTLVLLVVGLAFAAVAGRQLAEAAALIPQRPGPVILTAAILVIGLPTLAILSFLSLIGIPLGLVIAFFVIPALALLGFVVTATWIGATAVRRWGGRERVERQRERPYLAVLIGVLALQVIGIIPLLGGFVVLLASQLGAGALVYRTWAAARRTERA